MITFFRYLSAGLFGIFMSVIGYMVDTPEFWIGLTLFVAYGEASRLEG